MLSYLLRAPPKASPQPKVEQPYHSKTPEHILQAFQHQEHSFIFVLSIVRHTGAYELSDWGLSSLAGRYSRGPVNVSDHGCAYSRVRDSRLQRAQGHKLPLVWGKDVSAMVRP